MMVLKDTTMTKVFEQWGFGIEYWRNSLCFQTQIHVTVLTKIACLGKTLLQRQKTIEFGGTESHMYDKNCCNLWMQGVLQTTVTNM